MRHTIMWNEWTWKPGCSTALNILFTTKVNFFMTHAWHTHSRVIKNILQSTIIHYSYWPALYRYEAIEWYINKTHWDSTCMGHMIMNVAGCRRRKHPSSFTSNNLKWTILSNYDIRQRNPVTQHVVIYAIMSIMNDTIWAILYVYV